MVIIDVPWAMQESIQQLGNITHATRGARDVCAIWAAPTATMLEICPSCLCIHFMHWLWLSSAVCRMPFCICVCCGGNKSICSAICNSIAPQTSWILSWNRSLIDWFYVLTSRLVSMWQSVFCLSSSSEPNRRSLPGQTSWKMCPSLWFCSPASNCANKALEIII